MPTIETKFDVNDLVRYKFTTTQADKAGLFGFEVIEINAQKCYGGVQVFYTCRGIHTIIDYDIQRDPAVTDEEGQEKPFSRFKRVPQVVGFQPGTGGGGNEYVKLREDELMLMEQEFVKMLKRE